MSKVAKQSIAMKHAASAGPGIQELTSRSGFTSDFLIRFSCQAERRGRKEGAEARRLIKNLLKAEKCKETLGYEYAMEALCREKLRSLLMFGITKECKERGLYARVDIGCLKKWAEVVRKRKRAVICLRAEVHNWLLRWRLLNTSERAVPESVWEKKDRLEDFWSTFHDRSRVLECGPSGLPPPGSPASRQIALRPPTSDSIQGERPRTTGQNPSGLQSLAGSPTGATDGALGGIAGSPGGSNWGLDSAAPVCFGMRWDFEQSVKWKAVQSGSGTPAQKAVGGLQRRPGSQGSLAMAKSASLPTLRKGAAGGRPSTVDTGGCRRRLPDPLPPLVVSKQRYLQECDSRRSAPMPLHFVTGHSKKLAAMGKDLVDGELLAMAGMLQEMEAVEEVNLLGNALLTDRGLTFLLQELSRDSVRATLQKLILARCQRAGPYTVDATVKLLKAGGALRQLDLSQVPIATRFQLPLCQAIGKHSSLENVNLAETGFQYHENTKECLSALLSSKCLRSLDIGWNCFNGEVLKSLGSCVIASKTLTKLRIANCAATLDTCPAEDFVPPLSRFLEMLSHDKTLTYLDISMNRCDFRTALILEDSLDTHAKLRELRLSQNPLGTLGMRSILRLLCRDHTGLMVFDTEACYTGQNNESGGTNSQIFSYTNPGGKYELQLWRPYHRALLRMLYKTMDFLKLGPDEAFEKITFAAKGSAASAWVHPATDAIGVRQIPEEGELTFVFNVEPAIFKRFISTGSLQDSDHHGFISMYFQLMRFRPAFKKVIPMCALWSQLDGDVFAQRTILAALSRDFNLSQSFVEFCCSASKTLQRETVARLLPCIDTNSAYMIGMTLPTFLDFAWTQHQTQNLLGFNLDNPTGHYKLDLSNSTDSTVAERLLLLDRWEAALDRKHARKDTSSRGNGSHIRNEVFQGRGLHMSFASVAEWKMAEHGEFEFDYISNQRPSRKAEVLSDELWESILIEVYHAQGTPEDKIAALRSISHNFLLRSTHMRAMIGYFKEEQQRADVFINFYLRLVDMHNAKLFRVRFEKKEEVARLQHRLGYASFFPFFQPENARFELNLAIYDQRLCASMFVALAIKEKFPHNLHEYGYKRADGTEDPMPLGVPRSWGDFNAIPKEGIFRALYMSAPEDRNIGFRKEIAKTYGYYDTDGITEDDVQWWTGLTEPPEDVINLLEFFISRYPDVQKAFIDIDGPDGNGVITLKEFMEGLEEMECHKFDVKKGQKTGPTKEQRIEQIFRYLDPGGEGSVSREEWGILDQLWKEFDLSIREFVHFLMLSFGDDLQVAWEALDEDGGGELDEQEWLRAVENIGYFGPAAVVFALLDSSDDGNISFDEFEVLEKYKPQKYQGRA